MTDEDRLEFAHRIVGCMVPGRADLALAAIREIETAEREACAKVAEDRFDWNTEVDWGASIADAIRCRRSTS